MKTNLKQYLSEIGRSGGKSKSAKKQAAARKNGKKHIKKEQP